MTKTRLDILLVDKGLFNSREKSRQAIMAGYVSASGRVLDKPGTLVDSQTELTIAVTSAYVSRGADKLIRALDEFSIDPNGRVALDAGASTGGFTDVLLSRGAETVIAVDVGYGQLAWKLRNDPRVAVFERTNIRDLAPDSLPAVPDFVVADLSFISLAKTAPNLIALSAPRSDYVFLIKPQFEAGKGKVGKGGIIRDAQSHAAILTDVVSALEKAGLILCGLTYSPITGADGNIEFLGWFRQRAESREQGTKNLIENVVEEAHSILDKTSAKGKDL